MFKELEGLNSGCLNASIECLYDYWKISNEMQARKERNYLSWILCRIKGRNSCMDSAMWKKRKNLLDLGTAKADESELRNSAKIIGTLCYSSLYQGSNLIFTLVILYKGPEMRYQTLGKIQIISRSESECYNSRIISGFDDKECFPRTPVGMLCWVGALTWEENTGCGWYAVAK